VALSSVEHGYMKPHRSIFEAALRGAGVEASEAVMVGDSLTHDVDGARRLGMRGVLVARSGPVQAPPDVPVIQSLRELPALL
jgi:putative hydrolase of the HAD superfamily